MRDRARAVTMRRTAGVSHPAKRVPARARRLPIAGALLALAARAAGGQGEGDEPPGWRAQARSLGTSVEWLAPHAAFALEPGETLRPELGRGGLEARYHAFVRLPRKGRYRFGAEFEGGSLQLAAGTERAFATLAIRPDGPAWSEWREQEAGPIEIELVFQRSGDDRARLRALWQSEQDGLVLPAEPIPARFARAAPRSAASPDGDLLLRGRVLLEQKGCTNCHLPMEPYERFVGRRTAPDLATAGARLGLEWMERWIQDPQAVDPGADMPTMLAPGEQAAEEARALAHFLLQRSAPAAAASAASAPATAGDAARGLALYHRRGCVACHGALESLGTVGGDEFLGQDVPEVDGLHALDELAGKWRAGALIEFLVDPSRARPDGRMPSLGLSRAEAADIAAYLGGRLGFAADASVPDAALAARGVELYRERGCAACHPLDDMVRAVAGAQELEMQPPGSGDVHTGTSKPPRYVLDSGEREALSAAMKWIGEAFFSEEARARAGARAPLDELERTLAALDCRACHEIDGQGGVPAALRAYFASEDERADLGDEGRIPPRLDGVGSRLTDDWMRAVLVDGERARPYLSARMPHYPPELVQNLPAQLAARAGLDPGVEAVPIAGTDAQVAAGHELMGREALACVSCHSFRDFPLVGAPGPDLSQFARRIRREWFTAFLHDPSRVLPGTRMPSFASGGRSTFDRVLGGDVGAQIDALWACLSLGDEMPVPPDVEDEGALAIEVGERAVVMRTFLESAGERAIAVGMPSGLHYAFDAEQCRLVEVWRGDFLDAAGIWAGRGGTAVKGRGPIVWTAPPGPEFDMLAPERREQATAAGLADPREFRFRGYQLDALGRPTFSYEVEVIDGYPPVVVRESIATSVEPKPRISRTFEVSGIPSEDGPWLHVGACAHQLELNGANAVHRELPDGDHWIGIARGRTDDQVIRFTVHLEP